MSSLRSSLQNSAVIVFLAAVTGLVNGEPLHAQSTPVDATSVSFARTGPKSSQARSLTIKAIDLIRLLHCEQAVPLLNKAIALEPTNAWLYFYRGEALRKCSGESDDISLAAADYEAAIKRNPALEEPYCSLAMLYSESDNNAMAFKTLARLPKTPVQSKVVHWALAEIYAGAENYDKAIVEFTWLLKNEPKNEEFLRKRGACFSGSKKYQQAIADYTALIAVNRYETGCMRLRASAYEQLGKWNDAASDYQRIMEIEPKNDIGYKLHAGIMLRLNRLPEAISDYTKILKFAPDDTDAMTCRGEAFLKLGEKVKAVKDFTAAIDEEPDSAKKAYLLRAKCYQASGNISAAQADLARARRISSM